ncbi:MAG: class I SAM-dependent methyltransferase [Anaerolineae bacterium]|nr:MAG: class I SAM-dependent methyltransferase [Anaerolineae bacterium]
MAHLAPGAGSGAGSRTGTAAGRRPRVLEVGCGTGALLVELAQLPCTVLGVDRSSPMLAAARRRSAAASPCCKAALRLCPCPPAAWMPSC